MIRMAVSARWREWHSAGLWPPPASCGTGLMACRSTILAPARALRRRGDYTAHAQHRAGFDFTFRFATSCALGRIPGPRALPERAAESPCTNIRVPIVRMVQTKICTLGTVCTTRSSHLSAVRAPFAACLVPRFLVSTRSCRAQLRGCDPIRSLGAQTGWRLFAAGFIFTSAVRSIIMVDAGGLHFSIVFCAYLL